MIKRLTNTMTLILKGAFFCYAKNHHTARGLIF